VIAAQDGTAALAIYASRISEIAMVVTNVKIPFTDGLSLCRALKKLNTEVKILVSSGHKQPDRIQEIKSCGVSIFSLSHTLRIISLIAGVPFSLNKRN
jgi:DNA-binding NarL/FixJ family response regulator